jgi:hypothetical protein
MIKFDGLDSALIGYGSQWSKNQLAVYSETKIIEALIDQGMDYEEARDWYGHNIECLWCGEETPLIVRDL